MLRYKTETRPGLVALYDIQPGNGAGQFLQPRSPHGVNAVVNHRIMSQSMLTLTNILLNHRVLTKASNATQSMLTSINILHSVAYSWTAVKSLVISTQHYACVQCSASTITEIPCQFLHKISHADH